MPTDFDDKYSVPISIILLNKSTMESKYKLSL